MNNAPSANQQDDFVWEQCLMKMLSSAKNETINIKTVNFEGLGMASGIAGDNRVMFMPHSEGIYMALILNDSDAIENEQ